MSGNLLAISSNSSFRFSSSAFFAILSDIICYNFLICACFPSIAVDINIFFNYTLNYKAPYSLLI